MCHDRDGHPSYNTHLRSYKSRGGRGYPANFPSLLAHFKCQTCAVTLGARTYRTSKRVQDKGYHTKRQQESEVNLNHNMLAPQVRLLCPERRGASRYLSSGYMLGPCESAKEEEEEVQEGQGDCHDSSSSSRRPSNGGCCGPSFGTPSSASYAYCLRSQYHSWA